MPSNGSLVDLEFKLSNLQLNTLTSNEYLGAHLNNTLDWTDNPTALYKKRQQIVPAEKMQVLQNAGGTPQDLFFTLRQHLPFFMVLSAGKRLDKIIKDVSSVLGSTLDPVQEGGRKEDESQAIYYRTTLRYITVRYITEQLSTHA